MPLFIKIMTVKFFMPINTVMKNVVVSEEFEKLNFQEYIVGQEKAIHNKVVSNKRYLIFFCPELLLCPTFF